MAHDILLPNLSQLADLKTQVQLMTQRRAPRALAVYDCRCCVCASISAIPTTRKPPSRVALTIVLVMLFAVAKADPCTACCSLRPLSFSLLEGCHLRCLAAAVGILSSSTDRTTSARHANVRVAAQKRVLRSPLAATIAISSAMQAGWQGGCSIGEYTAALGNAG